MSCSLFRALAFFPLCAAAVGFAQSSVTTGPVAISASIPPDAPRLTIPLTATVNPEQHSGGGQNRQLRSEPIPAHLQRYAEPEDYRFYMDLGKDPAGRQHHLLGRPAEELNFLGSRGSRSTPLQVMVLREGERAGAGAEPTAMEPVTSGIMTIGSTVDIPFRYTAPHPVGTNQIAEISGALHVSLSGTSENQYTGHVSSRTGLSLSGSTFLSSSKLTASLNPVSDLTPGPDQPVQLTLEPHNPNVPSRNASGKASELLTLGPAKLAVESIASDLSQITLAAVHGTLAAAESEEASSVSALPAISQVELYDRRTVSSNDLLAAAKESGWLVLVFGEFKQDNQQSYHHGSQATSNLTLPARAIESILNQDRATPPTLAFVVRSIDLRQLYSEFLNGRPDYLVLSDYADPTQVRFQMPNPYGGGGFYPSPPGATTPATFRQILNLPDNRVSVVVVDASGKVRYLKADVGNNLQAALLEASAAMRDGTAPQNEGQRSAPEDAAGGQGGNVGEVRRPQNR